MSQLTIQGTSPGPYYVTDTSGMYPIVCSSHTMLREAQRSTLNTTNALAFDAGVAYSTLAPAQGEA